MAKKVSIKTSSLLRGAAQEISKKVFYFAHDWKDAGAKRTADRRMVPVVARKLEYRGLFYNKSAGGGVTQVPPPRAVVFHQLKDGRKVKTTVEVMDG